ncbi:MAG: hypothetical protein A2V67_02920 [Deltaproteobacteria bacterium RBG_13_61_14]|nr:MAG: hypothetical protein A2V67_02920 [Deltaproteobacteria bacterium RBG_13_61_14]
MWKKLYRWFEYPHRFLAVREVLNRRGVRVLDVGCGNHSPSLTKRYFPHCIYHGLDHGHWNVDFRDEQAIDAFFHLDLNHPQALNGLAENRYDAILCSHVLEHTRDPYTVVRFLVSKLKPGGVLYIEVPSPKTLHLPRARQGWYGIKGCLNFYDDETHLTMVDRNRMEDTLQQQGCAILASRPRFLWRRVILLPLYIGAGLLLRGYIPASVVWDITGSTHYFLAVRSTGS